MPLPDQIRDLEEEVAAYRHQGENMVLHISEDDSTNSNDITLPNHLDDDLPSTTAAISYREEIERLKGRASLLVLTVTPGGQVSYYRWTWIWRTTARQFFAYDGQYAWSQSHAYQVFVICIRRILHMTDQFSWSHWVRHIQVHLYISFIIHVII